MSADVESEIETVYGVIRVISSDDDEPVILEYGNDQVWIKTSSLTTLADKLYEIAKERQERSTTP